MSKNKLILSSRGQLTLPAFIRKKYLLNTGCVFNIEDRGGEIVLRPMAVMEFDNYTEKQIQDWSKKDKFVKGEKEKLKKKWGLKS